MPFLRRHWPVLTLILLPLTVLWRCVFLGECIGPWDQIMQMAPWNGPTPTFAWDVLQADGVLQFYPWRDLVFNAWGTGHLPFWNPYQLCGTPLLANSQSGGFYPLHILMGALHVPTTQAITLLAWFHLAWAALGARFLAKQFGANEYGAVTAGACFGMSAFMVSWTPLASVITTCAWIPWVLGFGVQVMSRPSTLDSRIPSPGSRPPIPALSASIAMMLLGGHLQFAAYGFIGIIVICLVTGIINKSKWKGYAGVLASLAIGTMLAAPQILPVLEFSKQSHRQVKATPEGATAYAASAIGLPELTGFVLPSATGLPSRSAIIEGQHTDLPAYWPAYIKRGANFLEGAIGVGPFIFALFFFARRRKLTQVVPHLGLALVGSLLALGPLSTLLYWVLPGWSASGSPGRAEVLLLCGLCVVAGIIWPDDPETKKEGWRLVGIPVGIAVTCILLAINSQAKPWFPGMVSVPPVIWPSGTEGFLFVFGPALVALCALILLWKKSPKLVLSLGLISTLVAGPLFCLPTGKPNFSPQAPDPNIRHAFVNSNWGLLNAAKAVMPGNTATASHLYDVAGYDSLLNKDTLEMLRSVNAGQDPAPDANGNMMFVKPGFDPAKIAEAGVTEVWSLGPLPQLKTQPEMTGNLGVYKLDGPGRAYVLPVGATTDTVPGSVVPEPQTCQITLDTTDLQIIEATGPGTLVVKDRNMVGWTAKVDGKPTDIKPGLWREVDLPSGTHKVEFNYEPPGFKTGLWLAALAILFLATSVGINLRQRTTVV